MILTETIAEIERLRIEAGVIRHLFQGPRYRHDVLMLEGEMVACCLPGFTPNGEARAAFIVALVNAAPQLIEAAERAEELPAMECRAVAFEAAAKAQHELAMKYRDIAERLKDFGKPDTFRCEEQWANAALDLAALNAEAK